MRGSSRNAITWADGGSHKVMGDNAASVCPHWNKNLLKRVSATDCHTLREGNGESNELATKSDGASKEIKIVNGSIL